MTDSLRSVRLVLGDQLSDSLSALSDAEPEHDLILMAEVLEEATYVRHHPQKIILIFSAMRHFAARLRERGFRVEYVALDDPDNAGSLTAEVGRCLSEFDCTRLIVTFPGEYRVLEMIQSWSAQFDADVEIRHDDRFYVTPEAFGRWAEGRSRLLMEYFYREQRKRFNVLMNDDGTPAGGEWNYDADNRKALPARVPVPELRAFAPDRITQEVMALVRTRFGDRHYGRIDNFAYAVTAADARVALDDFVAHRLPQFGTYQDAMTTRSDTVFHAVLSPYLNCGLLTAREVVAAVVRAWEQKLAPLNAVEGFVRQVLGWREYIRGVYWLNMPDYKSKNFFDHHRPLPDFFWTGDCDL